MPELPEVETVKRQLAPSVEGRRLERLEVLDPRWCAPLDPVEVETAVAGRVVERLSRRGKYLVWELEDEVFLIMHLRMTGTLLWEPGERERYTRVWFELRGPGRERRRLAYVDPRRFGTGELALGQAALDEFFASRLGVEPFGPEFTPEHMRKLARGRRAPVKAFLLDQRHVAGVGNIYADEALFRAGIHPLRPVGRLTGAQHALLRDAVVETLADGIDARGASIDDFRDLDGSRGQFQDRFLVYQRAGEPCTRCGNEISKMVVGGRGTYVCERCQPRPRRARRARSGGEKVL